MSTEETSKKGKSKLIIILFVVVLIISSIVGYFVATGKQISDITEMFESHGEYTVLLDEFIVNLQSENGTKNYLKIEVALMYTEEKQGDIINLNINKIRDLVINNIRSKSASDISNGENTAVMKKEMMRDINTALKEDIVKDVYFANMIIQ